MKRNKPLTRRTGLRAKSATRLRATSTDAGRKLWPVLRDRPVGAFRFQAAQRIGPFTVDFVCPAARLVILLDDEGDGARTEWLSSQGYRVLAFTTAEASDPQAVLDAIARTFELRVVTPRAE